MKFSSKTRAEAIKQLTNERMDVLIIGGGITGAGLALQAGAKKMKAGLIEMQDFAAGTSSRSTKLVHGGLRYLKQFEVELVSDIVKERKVINQNAPHIVRPEKMLLPVYDEAGASFTAFSAEVALDLYDRLADVDEEWSYQLISRDEVLDEAPGIKEDGLINGGLYLDYVNDDARLTTEILKKAHELGIFITNYVQAIDFVYDTNKRITGVVAKDVLTEETFEIQATVVVNATGPWSDDIRNIQKTHEEERMYPTKGVHFVVDSKKLPVKRTVYTDSGLEDNRMIFIIPRGNKTYFGTTDTPYEGDLKEPPITEEDIEYLLKAVNFRFPEANLTLEDIETGWSGLRPLILEEGATDPSAISREHDVFVSETGLVTIAGGKLTDYRLMAEDTFMTIEDELKMKTGVTYPEGDTEHIALSGGNLPKSLTMDEYLTENLSEGTAIGLSEDQAKRMIQWYGTNSEIVFSLKDKAKEEELPLNIELALLYALEYESAMTPVDFFLRRTDILLFSTDVLTEWKDKVVDYMADYFDWTEHEKRGHSEDLEKTVAQIQLKNLRGQ
ncbi:MAG TPA: FAD-dependent oxidoreductase [Atopostipes sp.]|nr:FAD-dependent oxidoreductase [Atopostipes sp.]